LPASRDLVAVCVPRDDQVQSMTLLEVTRRDLVQDHPLGRVQSDAGAVLELELDSHNIRS
jgi:hypothetical protein